jgi:hypothetical protein
MPIEATTCPGKTVGISGAAAASPGELLPAAVLHDVASSNILD